MTDELTALDRNTLRLWRAANLVGWGLAGLAAACFTFVVSLRTLVGFIDVVTNGSPNFRVFGLLVPTVLAGTVAGWIIGSHVYRWPMVVAQVAILGTWLPFAFLAIAGSVVQLVLTFGIPLLAAGVASLVSAFAYRRRPRALRSGP